MPEGDLPGLAAAAAERGGNLANPKPASPDEIEQLLRDVYQPDPTEVVTPRSVRLMSS